MKNVPDTSLGRMYREHIQFILDKNIDALLDQYADDCLLISSFMKKPLYYRAKTSYASTCRASWASMAWRPKSFSGLKQMIRRP